MKLSGVVSSHCYLPRHQRSLITAGGRSVLYGLGVKRYFSGFTSEEESEPAEFYEYLKDLKDEEVYGCNPDCHDGFDLGRIKRLMQSLGNPQSRYKVLSAVAFNLFAEENVDIAVIEAGLGGADDATNIAASVLTTIDEEYLAMIGEEHLAVKWFSPVPLL